MSDFTDGLVDFLSYVSSKGNNKVVLSKEKRALEMISGAGEIGSDEFFSLLGTSFDRYIDSRELEKDFKEWVTIRKTEKDLERDVSNQEKPKEQKEFNFELEDKPLIEDLEDVKFMSEMAHGGNEATMSVLEGLSDLFDTHQGKEKNDEEKQSSSSFPEKNSPEQGKEVFSEQKEKRRSSLFSSSFFGKKKRDFAQELVNAVNKSVKKSINHFINDDGDVDANLFIEDMYREVNKILSDLYHEQTEYIDFFEKKSVEMGMSTDELLDLVNNYLKQKAEKGREELLDKKEELEINDIRRKIHILERLPVFDSVESYSDGDDVDLDATLESMMDVGAPLDIKYERKAKDNAFVLFAFDTSGSLGRKLQGMKQIIDLLPKKIDKYVFTDRLEKYNGKINVGWTDFANSYKDFCRLRRHYDFAFILSDFQHNNFPDILRDEEYFFNRCVKRVADGIIGISLGNPYDQGYRSSLLEDDFDAVVEDSSLTKAFRDFLELLIKIYG